MRFQHPLPMLNQFLPSSTSRASRVWLLVLVMVLSLALGTWTSAADPIYRQRPYDELTLDENSGGAKIKVLPLTLPGRKMPDSPDPTAEIEVELLLRPGEKYKVSWASIAGIRFFEQLVLAEAEQLVQAKKFDEAYPSFQFLELKFPKTPGLKEALEGALYANIGADFKAARYDQALALLVELDRRNPERSGLATAYERVVVKLVEARIAAENYRGARGLLRNLAKRFPNLQATTVAQFETQLQTKATALRDEAQAALTAGKFREANRASRGMLDVWPALEGGQQLAGEIHQKYPTVLVGVTSAWTNAGNLHSGEWATLRTGRLLSRDLFEPAPAGAEGSDIPRFPFGKFSRGDGGRSILLEFRPGIRVGNSARDFTGQDVARTLLALADPNNLAFDPVWGEVFEGIEVQNRYNLQVSFRTGNLRPEAWLQQMLGLSHQPAGVKTGILPGPYQLDTQTPEQAVFIRQEQYFAAQPTQPGEIIERTYADSASALRALRRGEIHLIDRVSPWDLKSLAAGQDLVVQPYAQPTIHFLVPNPRRPLTASRAMRRAILHGIDREGILRRGLLVGQDLPGCEVISGPFPRALESTDRFGYAFNPQVPVRPYEPGVGLALTALALQEASSEVEKRGGTPLTAPPTLTLAHPADPVARVACESIARQLQLIGLQVRLREQTLGIATSEDYDLLYMEVAVREPVVDVWRLLGPHGITHDASPAMLLALRSLEAAENMQQAATRLQAIHQLAASELPVIPLWQMVDHCVSHKSLQGLGARPASLYQDVENWQVELRIPTE